MKGSISIMNGRLWMMNKTKKLKKNPLKINFQWVTIKFYVLKCVKIKLHLEQASHRPLLQTRPHLLLVNSLFYHSLYHISYTFHGFRP